jgi:predicted TIM-barrel fold metal-dependent hydrolase
MADARRIDVHFHLIPQFYQDAVYEAGRGPAIGRYPDWSPELALEAMDQFGIAAALNSLAQPGVQVFPREQAKTMARRTNDHAAELGAKGPKRFGAFATRSTRWPTRSTR